VFWSNAKDGKLLSKNPPDGRPILRVFIHADHLVSDFPAFLLA
jgi:hypothetical protein